MCYSYTNKKNNFLKTSFESKNCSSLIVCIPVPVTSDVCLEAEALPRGSLEAENLLPRPRLDVLMPRLSLA